MKTARRCLLPAVGLALAGVVFSLPGWAQDAAARQRVAALIQLGDLLLQQAAALEPVTRQSEQIGSQVAAEEKQLEAEVEAVEGAVREYNVQVGALTAASTAQGERCNAAGLGARQVLDCNDDAAKLAAEAISLEQRRVALDRRQRELNQRVDQHNARRLDWDKGRREQDGRRERNEAEVRQWLERARGFWSTSEFAALARAAGSPVACSSARLSVSDAAHPVEALKRMQQCLKAVRA